MNSSNASNYNQEIERADLIGQQFSHNLNLNGNVAGSNMFPSIGMPTNIPYFQENAPPHYNYIIAEVPYHDPVTQITESREFVEMQTVTGRGRTSESIQTTHSSQFVMQPENGNICQIQTMRGTISTTSQNISFPHYTLNSQVRNVYPFQTMETTSEFGYSTGYTTSSQMRNVCQYRAAEYTTFNTQVSNPYSTPFVASSECSTLHQSQTRTYACAEVDYQPRNVQQQQLQETHAINGTVKRAEVFSRKRVVSGFGLTDEQQMKTIKMSTSRVVTKNITHRVSADSNGSTLIANQTASTSKECDPTVSSDIQSNPQVVYELETIRWTRAKPTISYSSRKVIEDDLNEVEQSQGPVNCDTQPHPRVVYELEPIRWTKTKPTISYATRVVIDDNLNEPPYQKLDTPRIVELSDSADDDLHEPCPSTSTTLPTKPDHVDIQAESTSKDVQDLVNGDVQQHEMVSSIQSCDSPLSKKAKTKYTGETKGSPVRSEKKCVQVYDESSDESHQEKHVGLQKRVSIRKKETPFYMEFSSSDESDKGMKNKKNIAKTNNGSALGTGNGRMMGSDQSNKEAEVKADHSVFDFTVETDEESSTNMLGNEKANLSKIFSKSIYDTSSDETAPFELNARKRRTKKNVRVRDESSIEVVDVPLRHDIDVEKAEKNRSSANRKIVISHLGMSLSEESDTESPEIRRRIVDRCNSSDKPIEGLSGPKQTDNHPTQSKSPSRIPTVPSGKNEQNIDALAASVVDSLTDEYLSNLMTLESSTKLRGMNGHKRDSHAQRDQDEARSISRTADSKANGLTQVVSTIPSGSAEIVKDKTIVRNRENRNTLLGVVAEYSSNDDEEYEKNKKKRIESSRFKYLLDCDEDELDELLFDMIPEMNVTGLKRAESTQDLKTVSRLTPGPSTVNLTVKKGTSKATDDESLPNKTKIPPTPSVHQPVNVSRGKRGGKVLTSPENDENPYAKVYSPSADHRRGSIVREDQTISSHMTKECVKSKTVSPTIVNSGQKKKVLKKKASDKRENNGDGESDSSDEDLNEGSKTTNQKPTPIIRKPMNMRRCIRLDATRELRASLLQKTKATTGRQEEVKKTTESKQKPKPTPQSESESDSKRSAKSKSVSDTESESESESENDSESKSQDGNRKKPFVFLEDTSTEESYSSAPPSEQSGYNTECSESAIAEVVYSGVEKTFPKSDQKEIDAMVNKVTDSRFKSLLAFNEKNLSRVLRYIAEEKDVSGIQRLNTQKADVYVSICKSRSPDFEIPIEWACDSTWNRKATKNMILEYVFSNFQFTAPNDVVLENFERDFGNMIRHKELKHLTSVRGTVWYYHFRSPRASKIDHLTLTNREEELAAFLKAEEEEVTDYESDESCDENGINPFQIRKIRVPLVESSSDDSDYVVAGVRDDQIGNLDGPPRLSDALKPYSRRRVEKNMIKQLPADPDIKVPKESKFRQVLWYSELQLMEALERLEEVDVTGIPRFDPPNLDIVIELTDHPPRFENAILEALDATFNGIAKLDDIFEYIISRYHFNLDIPLAYEYVQDALKLLVKCQFLEPHGRNGKLGYRLDKAQKPKGVFIPGNYFLNEAAAGFVNGLRDALTKYHTPRGNFFETMMMEVVANNWCENNMERTVSCMKGMKQLVEMGEVRKTKKGRFKLTKKYRKFYGLAGRLYRNGQKPLKY